MRKANIVSAFVKYLFFCMILDIGKIIFPIHYGIMLLLYSVWYFQFYRKHGRIILFWVCSDLIFSAINFLKNIIWLPQFGLKFIATY